MSEVDRGRSQVVRIEVDRSLCVLCGEPNDCALAARAGSGAVTLDETETAGANEPCWCVEREFPEALTARAREVDGGAGCICRACLEAGV